MATILNSEGSILTKSGFPVMTGYDPDNDAIKNLRVDENGYIRISREDVLSNEKEAPVQFEKWQVEMISLLADIKTQLRKMNVYLSLITDTTLREYDTEDS